MRVENLALEERNGNKAVLFPLTKLFPHGSYPIYRYNTTANHTKSILTRLMIKVLHIFHFSGGNPQTTLLCPHNTIRAKHTLESNRGANSWGLLLGQEQRTSTAAAAVRGATAIVLGSRQYTKFIILEHSRKCNQPREVVNICGSIHSQKS